MNLISMVQVGFFFRPSVAPFLKLGPGDILMLLVILKIVIFILVNYVFLYVLIDHDMRMVLVPRSCCQHAAIAMGSSLTTPQHLLDG